MRDKTKSPDEICTHFIWRVTDSGDIPHLKKAAIVAESDFRLV